MILAGVCASCMRNNYDPVKQESMMFSAVASHTKDIISTTSYPIDEPFLVEAVRYPKGIQSSSPESFIIGEKVEYDSVLTAWTTAEEYLWPDRGEIVFYAGSPVCPSVSISAQNGVEADWEIHDSDSQADLCYAEVLENCESHSALIPIVFSHALSQICFKAKALKYYSSYQTADKLIQSNIIKVELDSVKIGGIVSKGHFTQNPRNWDLDASALKEFVIFRNSNGLELRCDNYENPILVQLRVLLLLPQELSSEVYLEEWHHTTVRTSVTDTGSGEIVSDETYSIPSSSRLPLAKYCKEWKSDYKYTFRLAIGLEDTEITAAVTDWVETREIILGDE